MLPPSQIIGGGGEGLAPPPSSYAYGGFEVWIGKAVTRGRHCSASRGLPGIPSDVFFLAQRIEKSEFFACDRILILLWT